MAVFGRVVLADDEMRHIGSEVEFVNASEVNNLLSNLNLPSGRPYDIRCHLGRQQSQGGERGTYTVLGGYAGAADNEALEGFGRIYSRKVVVIGIWRHHIAMPGEVNGLALRTVCRRWHGKDDFSAIRLEMARIFGTNNRGQSTRHTCSSTAFGPPTQYNPARRHLPLPKD